MHIQGLDDKKSPLLTNNNSDDNSSVNSRSVGRVLEIDKRISLEQEHLHEHELQHILE